MGHYPGRVHPNLASVVVTLDVYEIDRLIDAGNLIDVLQPAPDVGKVPEVADVALEMRIVDEVEAHRGREQPDVGLREAWPQQKASVSEARFDAPQRLEELPHRITIGGFLRREARPIHAVVDGAVDIRVHDIYLRCEIIGIEIDRRI